MNRVGNDTFLESTCIGNVWQLTNGGNRTRCGCG